MAAQLAPVGTPSDMGEHDMATPARARNRQLEALNGIARIATLDLELRPMLQRITDTLMRSFGWPFVACVSVDPEQNLFVCEALSSLLPSAVNVGYSRALGTGIVGQVALKGE